MIRHIILFGFVFLLIGAYFIVENKDYDLKENDEDRVSFFKDLSGWVVKVFGNTKELADEAKEKEWLPEDINKTNE